MPDQNRETRGEQHPGQPAGQHPNWFERNPKKTIIFIVGFVVILLDLILAPFYAERIPNIKNAHYHHDLDANFRGVMTWGPRHYMVHTNSLGFKDRTNRAVQLKTDKYRIVFIGDSFTEGIGYPYEETFVGLIDRELAKSNYEVLNSGVSSFSPKLYYLKIKYLIENVGLKFDELDVYLDISDIQDEIEYEDFQPSGSYGFAMANRLIFMVKKYSLIGNVAARKLILLRREWLIRSIGAKLPQPAEQVQNKATPAGQDQEVAANPNLWGNVDAYLDERADWVYREEVFKKWGEKGVSLAAQNMDKLADLCKKYQIKLIIAVYPWPKEVLTKNFNSKNILIWEDFCKKREIPFLNCYPDFFNNRQDENIKDKYYLGGDVHFNQYGQKIMAKAWLDRFKAPSQGASDGSGLPVWQH